MLHTQLGQESPQQASLLGATGFLISGSYLKTNQNTNNNSKIDYLKLKELLINFVKKILDTSEIDCNGNLLSYGIDSIMSMELANFCNENLNISIRQLDILQGISINKILEKVDSGNNSLSDNNENETVSNRFSFDYVPGLKTDNFDETNNFTNLISNFVTIAKESFLKYDKEIVLTLTILSAISYF